jgi:hypothetical protein
MTAARFARLTLLGIGLFGALGSVGCQVEMAGMTLPSPRYLKDDIQYFAEGPDFPFANEEAALAEAAGPAAR